MIYPENHSSTPLSNFIASNFIIEGVLTSYRLNTQYDARNNLSLEQFRFLRNKDYESVNIRKKDGSLWRPVENGDLIALSMNHSNIYCVDIDEDISWENIPNIFKDCPYTKSRNKKLPHFYFRINNLNLKKLQGTKQFTNATDNLNFCKGELLTGNTWEKKDNEVYNYNGLLPDLSWEQIKCFIIDTDVKRFEENAGINQPKITFKMQDLEEEEITTEEDVENEPQEKPILKPKIKKSNKKQETKEESTEETTDDKMINSTEKIFKEQVARLKTISKLWKEERINNYRSWLDFTWCIINSWGQNGKEIWNELSKELYTRTDKTFNEESNKQIWDNEMKRKKKELEGKTIATLYYWAKQDNPEEYEKLFNKHKIDFCRLTQAQYAKMLCTERFLGSNVVFTGKKKDMQGFKYNGVYWLDLGLHNAEIKKGIFDDMYNLYMKEFMKNYDSFDEKEKASVLGSIKQLDNNVFRNNVIECLKTEKYIEHIDWNKDRNLYAFNDCIYNLQLGNFIKPNPNQYINCTCGYDLGISYDEKNKLIVPEYLDEQKICENFVKSLFNDNDTIEYIFKTMSSFLKQINAEEKAYFWIGDGRNGKGTLTKLLTQTLGKYFGELNLGFYTTYDKGADSPNNNLFNLRNARLINTSEVGEDQNGNQAQKFITSQFKRMSGGDKLIARQPHEKEQIEFYAGKPLIQTNTMPELIGIDKKENFSLRERVVIVRFPYRFTADENEVKNNPLVYKLRDNSLKEQFETNENLKRGFWCLLISYYKKYLQEGLILPSQVQTETLAYFDASNKVKTWFDNNIIEVEMGNNKKYENDINTRDLFENFINFNTQGFMKKAQFIEYLIGIVGRSTNKQTRGILTLQNNPHLRGYKIKQEEEEITSNCLLKKADNELDEYETY